MRPVSGGKIGRTRVVSGRRRNVSGRIRVVSRGRVTRNLDVSRGGKAKIALSRMRREAAVSPGSGRVGGIEVDVPGTPTAPGARVNVSITPGRGGPPIGYGEAGYVVGGYAEPIALVSG